VVKLVAEDAERRSAFLNVPSAINVNARLPNQVFVGNWHRFYFMPSDEVFCPEFVDALHALLSWESAKCCCLLNLSRTEVLSFESLQPYFSIKRQNPRIIGNNCEPADTRTGGFLM
jgi:hypothetical protein